MTVGDLRPGDWFESDGDYYLVAELGAGICLRYSPKGMYRGRHAPRPGAEVKYLGSNLPEVLRCPST